MNKILIIIIGIFMLSATICPYAYGENLLKQGSVGDDVFILQRYLHQAGYLVEEPDGKYGIYTRKAVIDFQLDYGLEPDGVVGATTLQALRNFKSSGSSSSNRGSFDRGKAYQIREFAMQFIGTPYVWGGNSPAGFDCSGFIYYVFRHLGYEMPRMSDAQFEIGVPISKSTLQIGDMVFFSTYEAGPSHTGIYIGNDQFLHASSGAGEVTITSLSKPYYQSSYIGSRRIIY